MRAAFLAKAKQVDTRLTQLINKRKAYIAPPHTPPPPPSSSSAKLKWKYIKKTAPIRLPPRPLPSWPLPKRECTLKRCGHGQWAKCRGKSFPKVAHNPWDRCYHCADTLGLTYCKCTKPTNPWLTSAFGHNTRYPFPPAPNVPYVNHSRHVSKS